MLAVARHSSNSREMDVEIVVTDEIVRGGAIMSLGQAGGFSHDRQHGISILPLDGCPNIRNALASSLRDLEV